MYTATILEIDGLKVIKGIDKKVIDPIETEKKIIPLLQESSEQKAIEARQNQIKSYLQNVNDITKKEKQLLFDISKQIGIPVNIIEDQHITFTQREQFNKLQKAKDFNQLQIKELQKDIPNLNEKKEQKRIELIKKHAIYFPTPSGQIDLEENTALELNKKICAAVEYFNTRKKLKVVLLTGEVIDDLRGKTAWKKVDDRWCKRSIHFLYEKLDITETLEEDLIDEQKAEILKQEEKDKIESMTDQEKKSIIEQRIDDLLAQSVAMRSKLEIKGDPDALKKARVWYQEQIMLLQK